jgi:RimJ/RimL family protein N-acetyltransferase
LLEGKNVNLRLIEKEDLPLWMQWANDPEFWGEYNPLSQVTKAEVEKNWEGPYKGKRFFIEKKDGTKLGFIGSGEMLPGEPQHLIIGYSLLPAERGKGYGTEAVALLVDFLFLSADIVRISAFVDPGNPASQRVLEKSGFKREGTIRRLGFLRGKWSDFIFYGIIREDWKPTGMLKGTA